jgi:hypothetical protein
MYIGSSIFMIALGAILKYAVTFTVAGLRIHTIGTILIVAGLIGLVISLLMEFAYARRGPRDVEVVREREAVMRDRDPYY